MSYSPRQIDLRSLALSKVIADRIDADPTHWGHQKAKDVCQNWLHRNPLPVINEWIEILNQPWPTVKKILLEDSDRGQRLRQSNPFCGILKPKELWVLKKKLLHEKD